MSPNPRGRPRGFVRDDVLDRAITAFWAHGYDGASLEILTDSMGINRPSLYATFGNKHGLFLEVIDRYGATLGSAPFSAFADNRSADQAVAEFFRLTINCTTTPGKPRGCLVVNIATEQAQVDAEVRHKLTGMFAETERAITGYFETSLKDEYPASGHTPRALARMVFSVSHSIAIRARAGADRKALSVMADDFLALLFPGRSPAHT